MGAPTAPPSHPRASVTAPRERGVVDLWPLKYPGVNAEVSYGMVGGRGRVVYGAVAHRPNGNFVASFPAPANQPNSAAYFGGYLRVSTAAPLPTQYPPHGTRVRTRPFIYILNKTVYN